MNSQKSETIKMKVRVIKAADRPKSGVIEIKRKDGSTAWRCPCDMCGVVEEINFKPKADRDFHCKICREILQKGKPTTEYKPERKGKEAVFVTRCDRCDCLQETPFIPDKNRPFHCIDCFAAIARSKKTGEPLGDPPPLDPKFYNRAKPWPVKSKKRPHGRREPERRPIVRNEHNTRVIHNLVCTLCNASEPIERRPRGIDHHFICSDCFDKRKVRRGT